MQLNRLSEFRWEILCLRVNDTIVLMDGYGIQLELFIDSRHPKTLEIEPLGVRHLALKVD